MLIDQPRMPDRAYWLSLKTVREASDDDMFGLPRSLFLLCVWSLVSPVAAANWRLFRADEEMEALQLISTDLSPEDFKGVFFVSPIELDLEHPETMVMARRSWKPTAALWFPGFLEIDRADLEEAW